MIRPPPSSPLFPSPPLSGFGPAASRLCLEAKTWSERTSARPPTRAGARSMRPARIMATAASVQPLADHSRRKVSGLVHARSPHERLAHDAVQDHARVRRHGVSLMQAPRLDVEAGLRIEHDDVGVAPGRDPSFAREAGEPGRSLGAPAGEVLQVPAAGARSGPGGGEPHFE